MVSIFSDLSGRLFWPVIPTSVRNVGFCKTVTIAGNNEFWVEASSGIYTRDSKLCHCQRGPVAYSAWTKL